MGNEIIKKESGALTTPATQFVDAFADDQNMLIMPVAKVMQPTSEMLQDEDYSFKQGDIVHSLLAEKLPENFVVLTWHQANIMFLPKNEAEKKSFIDYFKLPKDFAEMFVCRAQDGRTPTSSRIGATSCATCPYNKFGWDGNPDTPPICTNSLNFLALFEGQEAPVVVQFANTSRTEGRRLYSLIKYSGANKPWAKQYKLTSRKTSNEKGVFYLLQVKPNGKPAPEFLETAEAMAREFAGQTFATDEEMTAPQQVEMEF